ncbi:sSS sodium solute transporter [Alistipes sp. CAG:268]|jgi:SSS family solute:Na+ symporter|uniref:sodium:solute symporter family transporter n=1 Tax=Alistipes sp. CAG:268 TaxID=1262693 RepID=UPI00033B9FF5|nr:sodium/solute symporter [Alistipes sp. CAG:268]CDC98367.1 sSS sodium solute transporter [Alistipes sp. CAG:268]
MDIGFQTADYIVFGTYALIIVAIGLFVSRSGREKSSSDYFLAGRNLSWWAIGASLIAANISAEQFIGMSGSGFRIGIGIAAYEWIAAASLIIVAKYLLPIMIRKRIYTMPQLLNERYGSGVGMAFSIFFLMLYLFVNLTSVAWLGALAMNQVLGIPMMWGVVGLLLFSGVYSIYGGLKAVVWTDVIQVVFLVGGGLIAVYFALKSADPSTSVMADGSAWAGLQHVFDTIRGTQGDYHLNMIIPDGTIVADPASGQRFDISKDLPGLSLLLGSIWVTNIGFWGFNQYIIQKGLAARSLHEAKKGLLFAGYLKILIPLIVVIPGITAYVLFRNPHLVEGIGDTITTADSAYPWLLKNFTPTGIKGVAFAALVAAIVSSLASMLNSTSTIFTMDIYKRHIAPQASERQLVKVGRIVAFCALLIAMAAVKPLLGGLDQAFQYIQEYSGYVYPGVTVVFGMGLLWKKATNRAALWTSILTIPVGIALKFAYPEMGFVLRMGYAFIILVIIAVTLSLLDRSESVPDGDRTENADRRTKRAARILTLLAAASIAAGAAFGKCWARYHFDAIFMLGTLLGFIALIVWTNAASPTKSRRAYTTDRDTFAFSPGLTVAAWGIVVILTAIYALFW